MKSLRGIMLAVAAFQAFSTLIGFVTLLLRPALYKPTLDGTAFAGQYVLAAFLLGVVVGGFQWGAAVVHLRKSGWWVLGHLIAGVVMVVWIAGECL
ncbi:MAG: hypothetical protein CSB46_10175, partial [Micrococcales bacterium]